MSLYTYIVQKARSLFTVLFAAALGVTIGGLVAAAATTISTNIQTDGTLSVTGISTLTGLTTLVNASSTQITNSGIAWLNGNVNINGFATTTAATGAFATQGAIAASSTLGVTGATTLYSTLNVTGVTTLVNASTTLTTNSGLASTSQIVVGGNATNGTIAGAIFGTCDIAQSSITASTTAFRNCATATGVTTSFKVFVQATSTLASGATIPANGGPGFVIVSASSTAANTISVEISNLTGGANTPSGTLNFWAVR